LREFRNIICPECGANIHTGYKCYCCGWKLKLFREEEYKMSYAYEICPDCGGIKWVQVPDYNEFQDSGTDAVTMKGCTCPPKPKKEVQTLICPHCKEIIQVL